jgi:hypothetical protein
VSIKAAIGKQLLDYTNRLVQESRYSGWGLAEYKYDPKRGSFVFMELNPKFWASCEFTLASNSDFAALLFRLPSRVVPSDSLLFLHRAIRLEPRMATRVLWRSRNERAVLYPGWLRGALGVRVSSALSRLTGR